MIIDNLPTNKKAKIAIALYVILDARRYDPQGFQHDFFGAIKDAASLRRRDLYAELEEAGYYWTGNRWIQQQ